MKKSTTTPKCFTIKAAAQNNFFLNGGNYEVK